MDNQKYLELYENAQKRMQDLYNWLKDKYNVKLQYTQSYANYKKISDYTQVDIFFNDLKAKNNSISLNTYVVEKETEYFLSIWYYTGGDTGHHSYRLDIKKDLVNDDDFFFEWVNDYIEEIFKLKPKRINQAAAKTETKKETYIQTTIFDFI